MMVGEELFCRVEVVIVDESDLWVGQLTNQVIQGALLDPGGTLKAAGRWHVDHGVLVAGFFHDGATLLIHGL